MKKSIKLSLLFLIAIPLITACADMKLLSKNMGFNFGSNEDRINERYSYLLKKQADDLIKKQVIEKEKADQIEKERLIAEKERLIAKNELTKEMAAIGNDPSKIKTYEAFNEYFRNAVTSYSDLLNPPLSPTNETYKWGGFIYNVISGTTVVGIYTRYGQTFPLLDTKTVDLYTTGQSYDARPNVKYFAIDSKNVYGTLKLDSQVVVVGKMDRIFNVTMTNGSPLMMPYLSNASVWVR